MGFTFMRGRVKKPYFFMLALLAFAGLAATTTVKAQETITLYAPLKYQNDWRRAFVDFQLAAYSKDDADWDVGYGLLYAGDDFDWLQSSAASRNRSVIKNLGEYNWTDNFTIPIVEPLAKLKPGERRRIGLDTSGADGADGAPGAPGKPGADGDGVVRHRTPTIDSTVIDSPAGSSRTKRDGKPKVDPLWVKAIAGHMYVIHAVDDTRDFYALFRVEGLERGDNCTISWRLIANPAIRF
jgi:hypothetical protein